VTRLYLALPLLFVPAIARADGAGDAALAEKLFLDGRAAMLAGDYAAGCPKLAESQRLDPGVGTMLNLGECYEKQGKTASAWATYREAEPMARRLGQKGRADHAAARAEALAASLAYLTLQVPAKAKDQKVTITVDATPISPAAWSAPIPVDPGAHAITASATGRKPWSTQVELRSSAKITVPVPELATDLTADPVKEDPSPAAPQGGSTQKTLGWIGVGLGGATLVTGVVFGLVAKSKNDDAHADGHCTDVDCDARGQTLVSEARDAALVSTILFAAGGALTAAGVVLVVTAPGGAKVAIGPAGFGGTW
jgi:hypothetical protein